MSQFQIALAVLGAVVLLALLLHGRWTARRKRVLLPDAPPQARTAESAGPVEPTMGPVGEPASAMPLADAAAATGIDPLTPDAALFAGAERDVSAAASPVDAVPAAAAIVAPAIERIEPALAKRTAGVRLDALIDAIAAVRLDQPVSGETVLAHLPATRRAGSKPVAVEGLPIDSVVDWEPPQPGQRYRELQIGVQLANRAGALNEIEYSEFVHKAQAFAEPFGALPDVPDMLDAVARGRELDAFASQHDAQLALRLATRGAAWSPGYVQQHAARHGFTLGTLPGRLVLPSAEEGAPPVLSLQFDAQAALADDPNQAPLRELTLAFDVPQTAAEAAPFQRWCEAGQALAADLDAALLDDGGQPLHPSAFEAIGQELDRLYAALAARDLAAGAPAARRLFS